jgi:hypothetical protein
VRAPEYAVRVCGQRAARIDGEAAAVFAAAHSVVESSRDVSDPTSGTLTLTPASEIVHGLRTPMSRTIDSGSNRKCTKQCGERFVTIRYRLSAAMTRVLSRSIWHHISPPGC